MTEHPLRLARSVLADALRRVRTMWGSILLFQLVWKGVSLFALGPLVLALMNVMLTLGGYTAVANFELADFFFSPLGVVTLWVLGTLWFGGMLLERGGLVWILAAPDHRGRVLLSEVFSRLVGRLPRLLRVALLHVAAGFAVALPLSLLGLATYHLLLSEADINYYFSEHPPQFWVGAAIFTLLALVAVIILVTLYLHWILAVAVALFERARGTESLRTSWELVSLRRSKVVAAFVLWQLLRFSVWLSVAAMLYAMNRWLIPSADVAPGRVLAWGAMLIVIDASVATFLSMLDSVGSAAVLTELYCRLSRQAAGTPPEEETEPIRVAYLRPEPPAVVWRKRLVLGIGIPVIALLMAGTNALVLIDEFRARGDIAVTAHRAGAMRAPENTLAALHLAIEEGADFAEIDVQETADGRVVVLHDADLRRVAGVPSSIWETEFDELRQLDVGSWFAPEFSGERVATLEEFLDASRGRIGLNIELKYTAHQQRLSERVVEILRSRPPGDRVILSSLHRHGLSELRRMAPELKIGWIASARLGNLARQDIDFLAVEHSRITPALLSEARRRGLEIHAWTVNRPSVMQRMLHLDVDNVITDDPLMARRKIGQYESLSDIEIVILRLHDWLRRSRSPWAAGL